MSASALLLALAALPDGAALYQQHCAPCHEAPSLSRMSQPAILNTLTTRSGRHLATRLTSGERDAIARFLQPPMHVGVAASPNGRCTGAPGTFRDPLSGPSWNGWGVTPENTRFQPPSTAGLTAADVPRLKLKWAFGFPGATLALAQPAVAGGRVFVGSATGVVYALDATTGCMWWSYPAADVPARTAISVGPSAGGGWAVYFGDHTATVHALDAATGEVLWKTKVDDFWAARLTGSPLLYAGRLYVPVSSNEEVQGIIANYECCQFRGSVVALDAASGRRIWKTYTIAEEPRPLRKNRAGTQLWGPAGAAIWSSPTLDRKSRVLYVATGNAYNAPDAGTSDAVLALDLDTGQRLWARQFTANDWYTFACSATGNCPDPVGPDFDFGSSPILRELPGGLRVLVAAQKSGMVYGLDPDNQGQVLWAVRVGRGSARGGVQWGPAADEQHVYVAVSDVLSGAPHETGGLYALRLADGQTAWYAPPPPLACGSGMRGCAGAQSAAVTAIPAVVFSGSLEGRLRAYSTTSGAILWDFDTARPFSTVNGVSATGGSIDGPGPVVAGGMLFTNSGCGFFLSAPGNVLLAFSVDGK